jgi:hypothetical protein
MCGNIFQLATLANAAAVHQQQQQNSTSTAASLLTGQNTAPTIPTETVNHHQLKHV